MLAFHLSKALNILAFHWSNVFWLFTRQKYFGFSFVKTILASHSSKLFWLFTRQNYFGFTLVKTHFGFSLVKTIKTHTVQLTILEPLLSDFCSELRFIVLLPVLELSFSDKCFIIFFIILPVLEPSFSAF